MGAAVYFQLKSRVARAVVLAGLLCLLGAPAWSAPDPVKGTLRLEPQRAVVELTIEGGFHINGPSPRDEFLIPTRLTITPPAGVKAGEVQYPPPVDRKLTFSPTPLPLYEGTVTLITPLDGTGTGTVAASVRYQACNDTTCLPPKTLQLTAERAQPAPTSPPSTSAADGQIASLVARWGTPLTLVWIFLGGVALNLTPCVYPLISVTVSFFGGRTGAGSGRALGHAIVYALGICATFTVMGVTAALTGSLFGAALQQPWVLGGIAALLVALACSNFGWWQLRPPAALMQVAGRASDGLAGAFFMGLTMGIVAAPCIGPFALGLLLYVGAQQDVGLGFAMFLALGLGLGAPYILLAGAASRLRSLPRGGAWLEWMERLFGFLLLAVALHFVTPLLPATVTKIGWSVLMAAAGLVLGFGAGQTSPVWRGARALGGVVLVVLSLSTWLRADASAGIDWIPYSDTALTDATSAGRPVLIDFRADWCLPCREMEHTTFQDSAVVAAATPWTMLRADVTAQDDAASALMARYHVLGVPTYVLLDRRGTERQRFVGLVPTDQMLAALAEASRG